jgi:hypothetical protein
LEDPGVDGRIILRWIFRKFDVGAWTGWIWPRIGTGGGHFWIRYWTFGFHKPWISWLTENRLASEWLCSIEWVTKQASKRASKEVSNRVMTSVEISYIFPVVKGIFLTNIFHQSSMRSLLLLASVHVFGHCAGNKRCLCNSNDTSSLFSRKTFILF